LIDAPRIAGIDGCRAGWFVVISGPKLEIVDCFVASDIAEIMERLGDGVAVGIDIPIGVPDAGRRECDFLARRLLSPHRTSSVFPAPIRPILGVREYAAACDLRESIDGKRLSVQAFNILHKIDEVDRYVRSNAGARFFEVHPELAFAAMDNGRPMTHPKRTTPGFEERKAHLQKVFAGTTLKAALSAYPRTRVARDDVLDAFAVLSSMARIAAGFGQRVPDQSVRDSAGLDMAIWF
jgi:predicted RNase H-like nuclease